MNLLYRDIYRKNEFYVRLSQCVIHRESLIIACLTQVFYSFVNELLINGATRIGAVVGLGCSNSVQ